ncbi:MAG: hypothetical protein PVSMB3_07370 [Candidatus Dormibacteraceae bacterium]
MPGRVTGGALEKRIEEQTATHVDGGSDQQQDDRSDEGELDEGLPCLASTFDGQMGRWNLASRHQDVVARLDPEMVIPPPRRFRSLKP